MGRDFQLGESTGAQVRVPPEAPGRSFRSRSPTPSARSGSTTCGLRLPPNPGAGAWTPFHVADETDDWLPCRPPARSRPRRIWTFRFSCQSPAGDAGIGHGQGRASAFKATGGRAVLRCCPGGTRRVPESRGGRTSSPTAWPARVSTWCGSAISTPPSGPIAACSMTRDDDTKELTRCAGPARPSDRRAKKRGIYVAVELSEQAAVSHGGRGRFIRLAPLRRRPGGFFDPTISKLARRRPQRRCWVHMNPETGLACGRPGAGLGDPRRGDLDV